MQMLATQTRRRRHLLNIWFICAHLKRSARNGGRKDKGIRRETDGCVWRERSEINKSELSAAVAMGFVRFAGEWTLLSRRNDALIFSSLSFLFYLSAPPPISLWRCFILFIYASTRIFNTQPTKAFVFFFDRLIRSRCNTALPKASGEEEIHPYSCVNTYLIACASDTR